MILWTIQQEPALKQMERTGVLRGDGRRCWPELRGAVHWMTRQMREKLGPPPRGSAYPVWAWKVYNARHVMPDLRRTSHLPRGMKGVRLEIDVPEGRVLLSDFGRWGAVICDAFCADSAQEWEAEQARPWDKEKAQEHLKRIEQSWHRIFELERGDPDWTGAVAERSIQATLWYVRLSEVRRITHFTAR